MNSMYSMYCRHCNPLSLVLCAWADWFFTGGYSCYAFGCFWCISLSSKNSSSSKSQGVTPRCPGPSGYRPHTQQSPRLEHCRFCEGQQRRGRRRQSHLAKVGWVETGYCTANPNWVNLLYQSASFDSGSKEGRCNQPCCIDMWNEIQYVFYNSIP